MGTRMHVFGMCRHWGRVGPQGLLYAVAPLFLQVAFHGLTVISRSNGNNFTVTLRLSF